MTAKDGPTQTRGDSKDGPTHTKDDDQNGPSAFGGLTQKMDHATGPDNFL